MGCSDFESVASTCSATPASVIVGSIYRFYFNCKRNFPSFPLTLLFAVTYILHRKSYIPFHRFPDTESAEALA